jgi:hypothetical protein
VCVECQLVFKSLVKILTKILSVLTIHAHSRHEKQACIVMQTMALQGGQSAGRIEDWFGRFRAAGFVGQVGTLPDLHDSCVSASANALFPSECVCVCVCVFVFELKSTPRRLHALLNP